MGVVRVPSSQQGASSRHLLTGTNSLGRSPAALTSTLFRSTSTIRIRRRCPNGTLPLPQHSSSATVFTTRRPTSLLHPPLSLSSPHRVLGPNPLPFAVTNLGHHPFLSCRECCIDRLLRFISLSQRFNKVTRFKASIHLSFGEESERGGWREMLDDEW